MIPSLSIFTPSFTGSLQQKLLFRVQDRDGDAADTFAPADEETDAALQPGCGATYLLRLYTSKQETESQFVTIGGGGPQVGVAIRTTPVTSMDGSTAAADVRVRNDCFP